LIQSSNHLLTRSMDHDRKYVLRKYYNPKHPGSYRGLAGFLENNKYKNNKEVISTLRELSTQTLHKPTRLRFKRRPVISNHIDLIWGIDIIIYQSDQHLNGGFSNILLTVDLFSKFVAVEKLHGRTKEDVVKALGIIFKRTKRKPTKIWADKDTSFTSHLFKAFLKKNSIQMYHSTSWLHAVTAERYIGTFKRIMGRIFTHRKNHLWVDIYQDVAYSMNHSYNRSIKMRSVDVKKSNESQVWDNLYSKYINIKKVKPRYKVGDLVKISTRTLKDVFVKSFTPGWGLETFRINQIHTGISVPYYTLEDLKKEKIQGIYYNEDLQLVGRPENSDE
jgi:hypothetical protein